MRVSVRLGAILIPEYLDFHSGYSAPRSRIAGLYSGIYSYSRISQTNAPLISSSGFYLDVAKEGGSMDTIFKFVSLETRGWSLTNTAFKWLVLVALQLGSYNLLLLFLLHVVPTFPFSKLIEQILTGQSPSGKFSGIFMINLKMPSWYEPILIKITPYQTEKNIRETS